MPEQKARRTGGRIRSEEAHRAVLAATAAILEESGYQAVTMERVATRAEVAKSTIYRWWSSKALLVLDSYRETVAQRMPEPDTGSTAEDLVVFVAALHSVARHPLRVRALRGLMAEAQLDPAFEEPFRAWVQSRRAVVLRILARGADRGELPATSDLEAATDQLFGLFWYRLLVGHAPLDPAEAPAHVSRLLDGLRST
ncbi:TetR/AcrR family transcriptional regulator [Streptomyces sp. CB01881]|uniref:TetR/AcrR family transcriptional regulator n=1 Tax=Streptomyces sp. CB01881 TaxID=2078691 RepID=UPI000CDC9661|nr:TetR/AcrR family transcriptional regulator [Streptomyces sp. CB01881]AUY51803.1 TetR family transcriptional regulator [Streptomyces sp. CB01881]TYC71232.1 TetR/AcrR family transcriptional regulator [Streptomyces sp. CB01881]